MFEFVIRIALLILCVGTIVISGQLAVWTTKPWWRKLLD